MKTKGFTLIEIIVVVALIGLFVGLFSSNFYLGKEQKTLSSALGNLRSFVDYTRSQSVGVLVPNGCAREDFHGYGLSFDTTTETVTQFYECLTRVPGKKLELSKFDQIDLVSVSPTTSVLFMPVSGEMLNTAAGYMKVAITIKLKHIGANKTSALTINEFGLIDEQAVSN